jgi:galactose mutarotase-like enzyme
MDFVIRNERLTVVISALGAELQSIKDSDGTEYLWNGNRSYWGNRAPNLFPYIGRLTQTQREIAYKTGISRSYVSQRA